MVVEYSVITGYSPTSFSSASLFYRFLTSKLGYDKNRIREFKDCVDFLELVAVTISDSVSKEVDLAEIILDDRHQDYDALRNFRVLMQRCDNQVLGIYAGNYTPDLICTIYKRSTEALKHITLPKHYFIPFNEVLVDQLMKCLNEAIK